MRVIAILASISFVAGCATKNELSSWKSATVQTSPEACLSQLARKEPSRLRELNSADIRVVNWNIQKGGNPGWTADLADINVQADLMILQEAPHEGDSWEVVAAGHHRAFAPGYRTRGASGTLTGVMTLSSTAPMTRCNFVSVEPWLRSPKATMITEYGLTDTEQSLLVVNIHAVNFTFGNKAFIQQVRRALEVIETHEGPILLSGDFNTWHWRQSDILQELAHAEGLSMLNFETDHRKRVFGKALDHIYIRGLKVINATTTVVDTSDHNPMIATLSL